MNNQTITVYRDGKQTRGFAYIEDTVHASLELAEKIAGCQIFNISTENEYTVSDLSKKVMEITNSDSEISYVNVPKKDMILKLSEGSDLQNNFIRPSTHKLDICVKYCNIVFFDFNWRLLKSFSQ
ncbi:MAG: hypothetical protein FVQ77_12605 [Cytophagales bacterium]|nr:hypothetical protein [Cytophagales bacterium]